MIKIMKNLIIKILIVAISISFVFGENVEDQEICIIKNSNINEKLIKNAKSFIDNNDKRNAINETNKVDLDLMKKSNRNLEGDYVELIQKFYEKGYTKEAKEFAELLLDAYSDEEIRIIKLFFRDEAFVESAINLLTQVGFKDIDLRVDRIEYLAALGQYREAEKLANELLETWINKDLMSFRENCKTLWRLASKIRSSYYYPQILKKCFAKNQLNENSYIEQVDRNIQNDQNIQKKIKSSDKILSIVDMLSSRLYIDPELGELYGVSVESIQQTIENMLYEVLKDNEIIFDILHALALYIKNDDPFFSIDILVDKKNFKWIGKQEVHSGAYIPLDGNIYIRKSFLDSMGFKGTMIHEITHKLMDALYDNDSNPYRLDDIVAKAAYQNALHDLEKKLDILKREYDYNSKEEIKTGNKFYDHAIESLINVRNLKLYKDENYLREYIVRFPQSIANGTYRDVKVQELMQPLADYWNQYIQPEINTYLDKNGGNDSFMSDSAREDFKASLWTKDWEALKFEILKSIIIEEPFAVIEIEKMLEKNDDKDLREKLEKELFDEFGEYGFIWQVIKSRFWRWYNSENSNNN